MIGCPSGHPYAFKGGLKCCNYPHENTDDDYDDCKGRPLTMESTCCFIGESVQCDEEDEEARCIDALNAVSSGFN